MRRIYESDALRRDDEPFTPNERRDRRFKPQAMRWVNSTLLSQYLVPHWIRRRAISISVTTPQTEYPVGASVPFRVTMRNSMPFPILIPTDSPLLWTWNVDGIQEASHVPLREEPEEPGGIRFDRGMRKQFTKQWSGMFQVTNREWEPATPGEYTIGAGLNVRNPGRKGLYDETTIRIVPEAPSRL